MSCCILNTLSTRMFSTTSNWSFPYLQKQRNQLKTSLVSLVTTNLSPAINAITYRIYLISGGIGLMILALSHPPVAYSLLFLLWKQCWYFLQLRYQFLSLPFHGKELVVQASVEARSLFGSISGPFRHCATAQTVATKIRDLAKLFYERFSAK